MPEAPLTVPLVVEGAPDRPHPQPVTVGIPFPRGALGPAHALVLTGPANQPLDLQAQPLAHWPDGSVRWLLLDFVLPAGGPSELLLRRGEPHQPRCRLTLEESPGGMVIDTGAAVFHLDRTALPPLRRALIAGHEVLDSGTRASRCAIGGGKACAHA